MREQRRFTPVTDAEIELLVSTLTRYRAGIPRDELARRFGKGDARRVRAIAHECRARRIAPVISTYSNIAHDTVYKIASSEEEIELYARSERSRIMNLEAGVDGLEWMKEFGFPAQQQGVLWRAS